MSSSISTSAGSRRVLSQIHRKGHRTKTNQKGAVRIRAKVPLPPSVSSNMKIEPTIAQASQASQAVRDFDLLSFCLRRGMFLLLRWVCLRRAFGCNFGENPRPELSAAALDVLRGAVADRGHKSSAPQNRDEILHMRSFGPLVDGSLDGIDGNEVHHRELSLDEIRQTLDFGFGIIDARHQRPFDLQGFHDCF